MNKVRNDRGEWVTAIGAPGSLERIKVERPVLIAKIRHYAAQLQAAGVSPMTEGLMRTIANAEGVNAEIEVRALLRAVAEEEG